MNLVVVTFIFTSLLYSSIQAYECLTSNPCQLDAYFTSKRGYQCIQKDASNVLCTCPGGIEQNLPCRLCDRPNPLQNVCHKNSERLLACIETDEYGTSYACLCIDAFGGAALTTNANCDTTVTLTPFPQANISISIPSPNCQNGGVYVDGICHCPSGYTGTICTNKIYPNLCERIYCKNNGTCTIQNINGPYEAVCVCPEGTWGEYCELIGTSGFCSSNSCMNEGACRENIVGSIRHAYCYCPAGYNGPKCENQYFACPDVGKYPDLNHFNQGKYFVCTHVLGKLQVEQKSCARGLRFNINRNICTY